MKIPCKIYKNRDFFMSFFAKNNIIYYIRKDR